jgi:hypothetical protein
MSETLRDTDGRRWLTAEVIPGLLVVWPIDQEPEDGQEWDEEEAGCTYKEFLRNGRRFQ